MSYISKSLALEMLDHLMGNTPWTQPTEIWMGLASAEPADDGSDLATLEIGVPGVDYNRVNVINGWAAASSGTYGHGDIKNDVAFLIEDLPAGTSAFQVFCRTETGQTPNDLLFWLRIEAAGGAASPVTHNSGESISWAPGNVVLYNDW